MVIALAVLAPVTAALVITQTHGGANITRSDQVQAVTVGLRTMDQELRQAYQFEFPTTAPADTAVCPVTSGMQACNQVDFLARLSNTGFSGTDFEVRYDCTAASVVVPGENACIRYLCSASAATSSIPSTCLASSPTLRSSRRVIDPIVNGTSSDPVFSLCYPSTTGTGCGVSTATRATSATVTLKVPSTPNQATGNGGDPAVVVLTDGVYFPNLDYAH